jgi:hypothetical protein
VSGVSVDQQVTDDQPHTQVGVGERSVEVRVRVDRSPLFPGYGPPG